MVKHHIWKQYGPKDGKGMLCMDCIESRIDRKLIKSDILKCPVTEVFNSYTAEILKSK